MFIKTNRRSYLRTIVEIVLLMLAIFALGSFFVHAQKNTTKSASNKNVQVGVNAPVMEEPLLRDYRGVRLGMTAEEARLKLGEPADKGEQQDFYLVSDTESAQIFYDASHKVLAICVQYSGGGSSSAPSAKSILGVELQPNEDGSVYKLVKYERAGYWVSYSRTAGPSPIVTVSMKRDVP